jgi:hypothetical protein
VAIPLASNVTVPEAAVAVLYRVTPEPWVMVIVDPDAFRIEKVRPAAMSEVFRVWPDEVESSSPSAHPEVLRGIAAFVAEEAVVAEVADVADVALVAVAALPVTLIAQVPEAPVPVRVGA